MVQDCLHKLAQQEMSFFFQSCLCVRLCMHSCKLFQQRSIKPETWTQTMASDLSETVDALAAVWWHTWVNSSQCLTSPKFIVFYWGVCQSLGVHPCQCSRRVKAYKHFWLATHLFCMFVSRLLCCGSFWLSWLSRK